MFIIQLRIGIMLQTLLSSIQFINEYLVSKIIEEKFYTPHE
jgi:hypothetical protein